jgi:hypothetical protein
MRIEKDKATGQAANATGARLERPDGAERQLYFGGTKGAGSARGGSRGDEGWVGAT